MKSFIIYLISLLVGIETKYLLIKLRDPNALRNGVVGQPMQGQMVPKGPAGVMPRIPVQGGGLGKSRFPRMPRRPAGGGGLGQSVPRRPAGGGGLGQSVMPRIPAQGGGGLGLSVMPRIPAQGGGGLGQIAGVMPRRPALGGGLGQIAGVVPQMMPILSPSMGAVPIVPILMGGWGSSSSSSSR